MKKGDVVILIICSFVSGLIIGLAIMEVLSYKRGQIDCINGNIKYELVTNPDKSTSWYRVK